MAAPAFQAKGTKGDTTTNTCTFTYPATAANDMLFLMVYDDASGGRFSVNASWTLKERIIGFGTSGLKKAFLYSKIATGSESGTENVTRTAVTTLYTRFSAQVYSYRGDAYLSYEDGIDNNGTSDTITWSSVTVASTQRTLGAFVINCLSGNPGTPTGYTNSASDTMGDGTYFELNTYANVSSGTSATTTGGNSDGWGTFHISLYNNTPGASLARTFIVN